MIEVLDGWNCDIMGITEWEKLPKNCRRYIEFIEKALGYPVTYVSTGPRGSTHLPLNKGCRRGVLRPAAVFCALFETQPANPPPGGCGRHPDNKGKDERFHA